MPEVATHDAGRSCRYSTYSWVAILGDSNSCHLWYSNAAIRLWKRLGSDRRGASLRSF
jgi:hypothetical protein